MTAVFRVCGKTSESRDMFAIEKKKKRTGNPPSMTGCMRSSTWAVAVVRLQSRRKPCCRRVRQQHGFGLYPYFSTPKTLSFPSRFVVETRGISMSSTRMSQRMVWVDLEMTGLDIEKDQIIEMACIITDSDLNVLAEGPNLIIKQPDELLDGMSDWCKEHHGKSGLTQAVRDSKISLEQAEYEFLSFIRQHTPPGQCPLAGNSVHADKRFLDKYMPQFMYHLHYRIVDVSTIKELSRRWYPEEHKLVPQKKASHRALDDILESIKELQYYREHIFKESTDEKKRKIVENGGSNKS
ncbi:small fragment nuclease isoform X2 [Melanotaenia boesemani]|uniref:small fragment nuclease isoform X2 n=1 Tax=Melanotaenia boesemani TaxID=1250792 RepID=UPI001C041B2D|nr:small fragment nuclease isoform X2 [Melanotaenia boesemani]